MFQNQGNVFIFSKKDRGDLPLALLAERQSWFTFLKEADTALIFFFHGNVQIQQNLTFDFKKHSLAWLVAVMLV